MVDFGFPQLEAAVSALEMYRGTCPACGDPGPHVLTQSPDEEPATVTCRKCKHVWPRGSERSNPGGPAGYIDW